MRIALLTAICGSVETWFRFLLATIGGADSYGYVSASQMIAGGRLIDPAPIAEWLSAPNRMALASPLGWTPSPDGIGIAPTFPIGVSSVMALFSLIGGRIAVFFVAPVMGAITLVLVYRLAREWFDAETALFATALVAWNPLFITYAKQPMSDMPATMWVTLALLLAVRSSSASAFCAGLAAGAAVITRPALLVAAADDSARRASRRLAAQPIGDAAPPDSRSACCVQMAIQNQLFGSPFSTGYGAAAALFSLSHVADQCSASSRGRAGSSLGPLWIPGLIIGLFAARPEPRWKPAAIFVGGHAAVPVLSAVRSLGDAAVPAAGPRAADGAWSRTA